jgi:hypothetical protein
MRALNQGIHLVTGIEARAGAESDRGCSSDLVNHILKIATAIVEFTTEHSLDKALGGRNKSIHAAKLDK